MNIFILDYDIEKCAQYHVDKHVVKMITEHTQMLSTAVRLSGVDCDFAYKITHQNHPCSKWVRDSLSNWLWLRDLTGALHDEWKYRYNHTTKVHKAYDIARRLPLPNINDWGLTNFALAIPDTYKTGDAVKSYRDYYINDKRALFSWKKRDTPYWIGGIL